jgi:hypothetical protein
MSKGTVYRFDATDDVITVTGADLFDSTEGAVNVHFRFVDKAAQQVLVASADTATTGKYFWMGINTTGVLGIAKLDTGVSATANFVLGSTVMEDGKEYIATFKSNGSAYSMDLNGVAETLTVSTGVNNGDWFGDLTGRDSFTIGALTRTSSVNFAKCEIGEVLVANFYPTAAEVKDLISGNIPFKWQYGSQTELVTNGDMELDANWADLGTPTTNERSSTQAHGGTYSRKFTVDAAFEGIKSDALGARVIGKAYKLISWVYPDDSTTVKIAIRNGDNSGWLYDQETTGLTQDAWNKIEIDYIEETSGSAGYIQYNSGTTDSGTWYIDDVSETKSGAVALYDQTSISETTWYDKANGNDGAVTGAEVLNAPSVTPLLALHMDIVRLQPGGTPGTNINCTQLDGISWNQSALTDTTNLAKDGTGGSFSLNAGGDELLIDVGNEVVGIVSCEVRIHDLNSSHATETYVPLCVYISGGLRLSFYLSGTAAKSDMTTILDAGDLVDVQIAYVTAT